MRTSLLAKATMTTFWCVAPTVALTNGSDPSSKGRKTEAAACVKNSSTCVKNRRHNCESPQAESDGLTRKQQDKSPGNGNLTPFDTNWKKGSGATPLTTQDLFCGGAISIPAAPTNHPICSEELSDFARRQKAAIRIRTSLLVGTYGSAFLA
jgi:hypothetical protein